MMKYSLLINGSLAVIHSERFSAFERERSFASLHFVDFLCGESDAVRR